MSDGKVDLYPNGSYPGHSFVNCKSTLVVSLLTQIALAVRAHTFNLFAFNVIPTRSLEPRPILRTGDAWQIKSDTQTDCTKYYQLLINQTWRRRGLFYVIKFWDTCILEGCSEEFKFGE